VPAGGGGAVAVGVDADVDGDVLRRLRLALALVVGCVLTGIVAFFVHTNRTTATQSATSDASGPTTKPI
jgi:hypothetical protein